MKLHLLTLTWNGEDKIKALQPGLMKNMENAGIECIWHVKDNGSKDDTVEWLKDSPNTVVYPVGHNRDSFAGGMNYLFDKAQPADDDLVLLLNNDVVFGDDVSLKKMIDLQKTSGSDMVGCRLLFTGTNKLQHAGVIFSKRYNNMPFHFRPGDESDEAAEKNRYFQAVTAAVVLVTAKSWKEVGGMDNKYQWAFEDIDLCMKVGKLKENNVIYCGGTKIFHEESASLKKNPVNKMFMSPNVRHFKSKWTGKYELDHDKYLNDSSYNEAKIQ